MHAAASSSCSLTVLFIIPASSLFLCMCAASAPQSADVADVVCLAVVWMSISSCGGSLVSGAELQRSKALCIPISKRSAVRGVFLFCLGSYDRFSDEVYKGFPRCSGSACISSDVVACHVIVRFLVLWHWLES
jgi:hypothetical protein